MMAQFAVKPMEPMEYLGAMTPALRGVDLLADPPGASQVTMKDRGDIGGMATESVNMLLVHGQVHVGSWAS